jgi:hypothetical protein
MMQIGVDSFGAVISRRCQWSLLTLTISSAAQKPWYKVSSYAGEQKSVSRIVQSMAASADPVIPKPPDR